MTNPKYPLKQVLEVKERRVSEAEKVVKEKLEALEKENKILKQKEDERDKVKQHYEDKLTQIRETLDSGMSSPKMQQMKAYLKVVKEQLAAEEKKVVEQKKKVEAAEKNLEVAKEDLRQKRQDVDKFVAHEKDWTREARKEIERLEGIEQDELGATTFTANQTKRKRGM